MSTLAIILGIVVVLLIIFIVSSYRNNKSDIGEAVDPQRKCDKCEYPIPNDYMKSLCPECKSYIAR
ncbi:hypothetical protein ACM26V_21150 [Salipaludibacillus sp. HK11]|uniref:hypothetical protein n=1 Tax=Salipaludibacillus sp. HK11 TaxID=3394320 RepID=UPI0039FC3FBA